MLMLSCGVVLVASACASKSREKHRQSGHKRTQAWEFWLSMTNVQLLTATAIVFTELAAIISVEALSKLYPVAVL